MTPDVLAALDNEPQGKMPQSSTLGAFGRGAWSGATLGISPFADPAAQEQAWQQHPGAYGAGYAGATLAESLGPGALAKAGSIGSKVLDTISAAKAARTAKAAEDARLLAAPDMASVYKGTGLSGPAAVTTPAVPPTSVMNQIKGAVSGRPSKITTGQAAGTVGNAIVNPPEVPQPQAPMPAGQAGQPSRQVSGKVSEAAPETGPFATLASFLAQAADSANPDVQSAATQAQQAVDPNDPDAKRKIAMLLQGSPAGRAVGNSDSSLNNEA